MKIVESLKNYNFPSNKEKEIQFSNITNIYLFF